MPLHSSHPLRRGRGTPLQLVVASYRRRRRRMMGPDPPPLPLEILLLLVPSSHLIRRMVIV